MTSATLSLHEEHDALADLLLKRGDRVTGSGAGDTKKIVQGAFASYALKHEIGHGGFGVVWKANVLEVVAPELATDLWIGSTVAVKMFNAMRHIEPLHAWGEVEHMQACIHPNILRLHDHGKDAGGDLCLVLEFAAGGTMEDYTADLDGELPEEEACRIFRQILDAVSCIHAAGIIHCDLKPSNFMLDAEKNVKVIDFGSSCKKEAGQEPHEKMHGTSVYCAPEQLDLQAFDESVDLWSIGVILYEMLTGELPDSVYDIARGGGYLPEPRRRRFKDAAWDLIKGLVTSRSQRIVEAHRIQDLAEEWHQDLLYADEAFSEIEAVLDEGTEEAEGEDDGYEDADFDSCSSEHEM